MAHFVYDPFADSLESFLTTVNNCFISFRFYEISRQQSPKYSEFSTENIMRNYQVCPDFKLIPCTFALQGEKHYTKSDVYLTPRRCVP